MTLSASAAYAASSCFAASVLCAGVLDLTTMKIRNDLVLFMLAVYAAMAPLSGLGASDIGMSALVSLAVLAGTFAMFAMGWVGGGDAKAAAVVALWLGAGHTIDFLLFTAVFGAAFTLLLLQFRSTPLPDSWYRVPWIAQLHAATSGVPYGVAISAAALFVFPGTPWMAALT